MNFYHFSHSELRWIFQWEQYLHCSILNYVSSCHSLHLQDLSMFHGHLSNPLWLYHQRFGQSSHQLSRRCIWHSPGFDHKLVEMSRVLEIIQITLINKIQDFNFFAHICFCFHFSWKKLLVSRLTFCSSLGYWLMVQKLHFQMIFHQYKYFLIFINK